MIEPMRFFGVRWLATALYHPTALGISHHRRLGKSYRPLHHATVVETLVEQRGGDTGTLGNIRLLCDDRITEHIVNRT